jgi:hypothetical protein
MTCRGPRHSGCNGDSDQILPRIEATRHVQQEEGGRMSVISRPMAMVRYRAQINFGIF